MTLGETTNEEIRVFLGIFSDPLQRIDETNTEWWLGAFSLDKYRPTFRVGFGGGLTSTSRFRKQWFAFSDKGVSGWAVIFRSFDHGLNGDGPEEFFIGWVPPEREADADLWLTFLNNEVAERLRSEPSRGTRPSDSKDKKE